MPYIVDVLCSNCNYKVLDFVINSVATTSFSDEECINFAITIAGANAHDMYGERMYAIALQDALNVLLRKEFEWDVIIKNLVFSESGLQERSVCNMDVYCPQFVKALMEESMFTATHIADNVSS